MAPPSAPHMKWKGAGAGGATMDDRQRPPWPRCPGGALLALGFQRTGKNKIKNEADQKSGMDLPFCRHTERKRRGRKRRRAP